MPRVKLFFVTALLEVGIGFLLLVIPSIPFALLLGVEQASPEATVIARVAGAALLSLGSACWLARKDEQSRAATGLMTGMLLYNTAVIALLVLAGTVSGFGGIGLWPAVMLHTAMAAWCLACLRGHWIDLVR